MMKRSVAARQKETWFWLLGALTIAICLMLNARAIAGETGSTDEYGGVAINNSVLLDPFDPVPSIHFRDGGCDWDGCGRDCAYRDCGERFRCHDNCRWHGWYCEHACYDINRPRDGAYNVGWWRCANECRDGDWWCDHDCHLEGWHCDHDCFIHEPGRRYGRERGPVPPMGDACPDVCYGRLVHEYEEALAHHAEEARKYEEQSRWYFEHVMDDHRGFFERLFDWHRHDGPPPMPPGPPPPPPMHGPDGPHGPGSYGPPPPPGGGYGPDHGPGPGAAYGPGPGSSYGPPGPPPGPGHDGYGPPPPASGPGPGSSGGSAPPPPPGSGPTPPGGPAGPGPGDFGPPPGPPPH
ncbi:MAG TPA: hypothetical protein VMD53_01505 [Rhizomicrobium sp.]|nr:hypothetical protein [Rhizomicrobium sp.]